MVWAEDAINQFGCRVVVDHLFIIVPDPSIAYDCLLASGQYTECPDFPPYVGGVLQEAPRLVPIEGSSRLPIALLQASDWPNLPPLPLSPDPKFPALHVLLSSLLQMWLQHPYSEFSSWLAVWICSIYDARALPALVPPAEGDPQDSSYFVVAREIPARIRQLHVDMVYERIFSLAHSAYVHYKAVAQDADRQVAISDNPDPIDLPPPSVNVIGGNIWPWCVKYTGSVHINLLLDTQASDTL
jgi:hypothetical protein